MIRVGMVGLGFMAMTHLKAYRQLPAFRIAALGNPSGRNLDGDFSKVTGNIGDKDAIRLDMTSVKAYRDLDALIAEPDLDLIDICTPTPSHPELAIKALRAGKHVLCEKPMARTSALAREMVAVARETGKILMPAMCLRFWPEWAYAKQAVASGEFGKVLAARFRRVAEPPGWGKQNFMDGQKSGGALLDLHIHDTDFVQWCFGRPRSVFSTGYSVISGAVDHVVTQYEVACGAIVHAEGGWAMTPGFGFNMAYTLNFERATLDYDLARGADALRLCRTGETPTVEKLDAPDGYVGELKHLAEAIVSGREPSVVKAEEGISALEICEAEEQSVLGHRPVALT